MLGGKSGKALNPVARPFVPRELQEIQTDAANRMMLMYQVQQGCVTSEGLIIPQPLYAAEGSEAMAYLQAAMQVARDSRVLFEMQKEAER